MGECHTLKLERPETRCHKVGGEVLEGVLSRTCWKHSERCCPALKVQQSSLDVNTAVQETGRQSCSLWVPDLVAWAVTSGSDVESQAGTGSQPTQLVYTSCAPATLQHAQVEQIILVS